MSKLETPMMRWYWRQVGGTLIEEFHAVRVRSDRGRRHIDGIILPEGAKKIAHWKAIALEGEDIIVVQAKRGTLGMSLMGQAFFSDELMRHFGPKSIGVVAICRKRDGT